MQGAFIQSLTYCPPLLLHRQLLPFSSWHGLILEAAGSPFICEGVPEFSDLILGIWVCSHNFSDGFQAAADVLSAQKWGRKNRRHKISNELSIFQEYVDAAFVMPKYWPCAGGESIKAPYWWHCAMFAMRELGLSETQAWDYPVTRIACAQACVAEINGNKDLLSSDDIRGLEILRKEKEKEK